MNTLKASFLFVSLLAGLFSCSLSFLTQSFSFGKFGATLGFSSLLSLTFFFNLDAELLLLFFLLLDDGKVVIMLIFFLDDAWLILAFCLFVILSINSGVVLVLATTALALLLALRLFCLINLTSE